LVSLVLPDIETGCMSYFLAEVSHRHPDDSILMVIDRAGWHITHGLRLPENMRLLWLPPYGP